MIDTHCHLTDPKLRPQVETVLRRAAEAGVTRMITVGTDLEDDRDAIELAGNHTSCLRCAVGIHPNHSQGATAADVETLRGLQKSPSVVALGEMGLDYFHHYAEARQQALIFQAQLQLAGELGRPVVIHCREAIDDCLAIMRSFRHVRAVFHCFTGTLEEARRILEAGYLLSFTGAVTFRKNQSLRDAVRYCNASRLLLETDAPYLSPEPVRKEKINQPALMVHTAALVASLKEMSLEDLDRTTSATAAGFFGWP